VKLSPTIDLRVRTAAATKLRELRLAAGLTLTEVARRLHSHRPVVCRVERGVHCVSLDTANAYAQACGGTLRDVLQAVDEALGLKARAA
jgi:transcriptional regulator with XRE-family HTH domain